MTLVHDIVEAVEAYAVLGGITGTLSWAVFSFGAHMNRRLHDAADAQRDAWDEEYRRKMAKLLSKPPDLKP